MSLYTWIRREQLMAIADMTAVEAMSLLKRCQKKVWFHHRNVATVGQLLDAWPTVGEAPPPLLMALAADEREYPTWLQMIVHEHRHAKMRPKSNYKSKVAASGATTYEQARAVVEALPDIEARGYLEDEGLPPEMMIADRFKWTDEEDDDG